VEDAVERHGVEAGVRNVERFEHTCFDDPGRVARETLRRLPEAGLARVEQGDLRPLGWEAAAVEKVAGADADVEVTGATSRGQGGRGIARRRRRAIYSGPPPGVTMSYFVRIVD